MTTTPARTVQQPRYYRTSTTLNPSSDSVNYYKFTLTTQKDVQISVLNQETDDAVTTQKDCSWWTMTTTPKKKPTASEPAPTE